MSIEIERIYHVRPSNPQPHCRQASDTAVELIRQLDHRGPFNLSIQRLIRYNQDTMMKIISKLKHVKISHVRDCQLS